MFNIFIDDLNEGIKCTFSSSAENTMMGGNVELLEDRRGLQRDLVRMVQWGQGQRHNVHQGQALGPALGTQQAHAVLKADWLESGPVEKDLRDLGLNMTQESVQVAKMTDGTPACIGNKVASSTRAVLCPCIQYCSGLTSVSVHFWASHEEKDIQVLEVYRNGQ